MFFLHLNIIYLIHYFYLIFELFILLMFVLKKKANETLLIVIKYICWGIYVRIMKIIDLLPNMKRLYVMIEALWTNSKFTKAKKSCRCGQRCNRYDRQEKRDGPQEWGNEGLSVEFGCKDVSHLYRVTPKKTPVS